MLPSNYEISASNHQLLLGRSWHQSIGQKNAQKEDITFDFVV